MHWFIKIHIVQAKSLVDIQNSNCASNTYFLSIEIRIIQEKEALQTTAELQIYIGITDKNSPVDVRQITCISRFQTATVV